MSLLSYEQALSFVITDSSPLDVINLALADSFGRILAQDAIARVDLPQFDNSQMDGYAVNSSDIVDATDAAPVTLPVSRVVPAGSTVPSTLHTGEAVKIFTGAPISAGADCVVPIEDVLLTGAEDRITITEAASAGQYIRRAGEDVRAGQKILSAGTLLGPGQVALLAASGIGSVYVYRQARVAILTNGDELVGVGSHSAPLGHGQIYESNSLMLAEMARRCGASVVGIFSAKDSRVDLVQQFAEINITYSPDLIVSSGGVSVGDRDYIRSVLAEIGEIVFWRAAIRPGKPIVYGRIGGAHFLGLPGNPASTLVTFELFARPMLSKLHGGTGRVPNYATTIDESITHEPGRRSYVRAVTRLTSSGLVSTPAGGQGSHFVSSLSAANSLIEISEEVVGLSAGEQCRCYLLEYPAVG